MKLTRKELAEALAKAMNLLNDVEKDGWTGKQLGEFHELAHIMPDKSDYVNNGTVMPNDL